MNIFDLAISLPPTSRRTLAIWLLRSIGSTDAQVMLAAKEARKINQRKTA